VLFNLLKLAVIATLVLRQSPMQLRRALA